MVMIQVMLSGSSLEEFAEKHETNISALKYRIKGNMPNRSPPPPLPGPLSNFSPGLFLQFVTQNYVFQFLGKMLLLLLPQSQVLFL